MQPQHLSFSVYSQWFDYRSEAERALKILIGKCPEHTAAKIQSTEKMYGEKYESQNCDQFRAKVTIQAW